MPAKMKPVKRGKINVQLSLVAPGLSPTDVAEYVRRAVESYSGCLAGDDPRRGVRVVRVWRLGWIDPDDAGAAAEVE